MIDRIRKILEYYNLSASQFADKVGVQRSSISHVLSGRNKPSLEFVQKVLQNFPEISSDWIISGKGNIIAEIENSDLFTDNNNEKNEDDYSVGKMKPVQEEKEKLTKPIKTVKENPISVKDQNIERIVIFYKNGKFKEYIPE